MVGGREHWRDGEMRDGGLAGGVDGEMGRQGDGEMGKWRVGRMKRRDGGMEDGGMERWRDGGIDGGWRDGEMRDGGLAGGVDEEMGRQGDGEIGRWRVGRMERRTGGMERWRMEGW